MKLPGISALTTRFTGNIHPYKLVTHSITTATAGQAINPMIVSHVEFSVRDSVPVPRYPPVIAVFAKVLCRMISPGDTVRVSPNDADTMLGHVINVEANRGVVLQSLIPVH